MWYDVYCVDVCFSVVKCLAPVHQQYVENKDFCGGDRWEMSCPWNFSPVAFWGP